MTADNFSEVAELLVSVSIRYSKFLRSMVRNCFRCLCRWTTDVIRTCMCTISDDAVSRRQTTWHRAASHVKEWWDYWRRQFDIEVDRRRPQLVTQCAPRQTTHTETSLTSRGPTAQSTVKRNGIQRVARIGTGFHLSCRLWSTLNWFRRGQGGCAANVCKWWIALSDKFSCGQPHTMNEPHYEYVSIYQTCWWYVAFSYW